MSRRDALTAGGMALIAGLIPRGAVRVSTQGGVRFSMDGPANDRLQSLLDAARPGSIVVIPRGHYLIDPQRPLLLRSGLTLDLRRGVVLQAMATALGSYAVVQGVELIGVRVLGGRITGERHRHLVARGGEWGMGIDLRSCRDVRIVQTIVSDCWGDGLYIGQVGDPSVPGKECTDILVDRCQFVGNRRQGASVTSGRRIRFTRCEFRGTGGTAPGAGLDLEPNGAQVAEDIVVDNCRFTGNAGPGVLLVGEGVARTQVRRSTFVSNREAGIRVIAARDSCLQANVFSGEGGPPLMLERSGEGLKGRGNEQVDRFGTRKGLPLLAKGPHIAPGGF